MILSDLGSQIPDEYYKIWKFQKNFNILNVPTSFTCLMLIQVLNMKIYSATTLLMILQY